MSNELKEIFDSDYNLKSFAFCVNLYHIFDQHGVE